MRFHFPDPGRIIHDIENAAHHAADQARGGIDQAAHAAIGGIERAEHDAVGRATAAIHSAEGDLQTAAHALKGDIAAAGHNAEASMLSVAGDLEGAVKKAGREAVAGAESAVEKALDEAFQAAAKRACEYFVKMVKRFQPAEARLVLGPFTFHFAKPVDKVEAIVTFANNPSTTRADLRALVEAIAPTSVDADMSVTVPVIDLGVGGGLTIETADFLDGLEDTLDDLGL